MKGSTQINILVVISFKKSLKLGECKHKSHTVIKLDLTLLFSKFAHFDTIVLIKKQSSYDMLLLVT